MWTDKLGKAIKECNAEPYTMSLTYDDAKSVTDCVNQGIDAHLEACYIKERGDSYEQHGNRLECEVSRESLPVLVRRLLESEDENAHDLANSICETIGIELI